MWPDERDLAAELAAGGAAARDRLGAGVGPDPAFASALRSQLLTDHPAAVGSFAPRRRWTLADLFRGRRLAPTLAGALLIVAAGAAARTVLVGNDPAPVSPTPGISLPAVVVGELEGEVATPSPSPTPTPTPSPSPTPTPTPSPTPSPSPSPTPTPVPTPKPTPVPTPTPTPVPTVGTMALTASGCNGGVVLEWSKVLDERFNHYTTLRSSSPSIPAAYPPQDGAIEVDGSYTMDATATSAVDPSAGPGTTLHYRTLAFDSADRVMAASPVRSAVAKPVAALGALTYASEVPGSTTFGWTPYDGPGACFSYYKLVASESDPTPSYLEDSSTWAAIADQGATSATVDGTPSGTTWYVRLQAIRATALGKIVVAQTDVLTWTAP